MHDRQETSAENLQDTILKNKVVKMLNDRAISPTQQRVKIGMVLFTEDQHLSADQVLDMVNTKGNFASKATVYNTLGLFARKGLIREVIVDSTKVFYDSNIRPHHHFYNIDSGTLHDVEADQLHISSLPTPPDAAEVKDVSVIIRIQHKNQ
ncbi:MAG: transcriptional repressor [Gammaproteobacteria bacterium]|nr:transcriptional repressor [Gammaproteobacteria bacterium]